MAMSKPVRIPHFSSSSSSATPDPVGVPWLDLPPHIIDQILEFLPLTDYIRFCATCKKWGSIQCSHRLRYSPPNLPLLPWIVPSSLFDDSAPASFYSPFEVPKRTYHLDLAGLGISDRHRPIAYTHGWFFLEDMDSDIDYEPVRVSLFNPVSRVLIPVPSLRLPLWCAISSSPNPSPSNPNCILLLLDDGVLRLFRLEPGHAWAHSELQFPPNFPSDVDLDDHVSNPIFYCGKFYCVFSQGNLMVVDPLVEPHAVEHVQMGGFPNLGMINHIVESDGDLLFLMSTMDMCGGNIDGFELFRMDLERRVWVKVQSIGDDRVLLYSNLSAYSVLAADVGMQSGNCIVFFSRITRDEQGEVIPMVLAEGTREEDLEFRCLVFHLSNRRIQDIGGGPKCIHINSEWFIPTLC